MAASMADSCAGRAALAAVEAAMRLSDASAECPLSSLAEGVTVADPTQPGCPIVYANDAFYRMTGYSRDESLGRNHRFLQGPDTDPAAIATIREALQDSMQVTVELVNYRKDGDRFWNRLTITPVRDAAGRVAALVGVQLDVTELVQRRRAERDLQLAKARAESATEAKGMFLANMSHEIRTPLNGMIATAQMLLATHLTPEQRELADTILDSGNTLLTILGDILDFSKIDHNSMVLEHVPLWVRDTVEATCEMAAAQANNKGIELSYSIDPVLAERPLIGDSTRIRQILNNLMSNAVKFTDSGSVTVRCVVDDEEDWAAGQAAGPREQEEPHDPQEAPGEEEEPREAAALPPCSSSPPAIAPPFAPGGASTGHPRRRSAAAAVSSGAAVAGACSTSSEEDGGEEDGGGGSGCEEEEEGGGQRRYCRLHVSVQDTGIGISSDATSRLFQCFRQANESMSRRYGGTGLGLAISRGLSERMGGRIWVKSQPGQGSTFHFTALLPWADPDQLPGSPSGDSESDSDRRLSDEYLPGGIPSNGLGPREAQFLRGRKLLVDCPHAGTQRQIAESGAALGMQVSIGCAAAPGAADQHDFCVVFVENCMPAMRIGGWKGRPIVALGKREQVPVGLQPLLLVVARPVRHTRLATALLRSSALMRGSKSECASLLAAGVQMGSSTAGLAAALRRAGGIGGGGGDAALGGVSSGGSGGGSSAAARGWAPPTLEERRRAAAAAQAAASDSVRRISLDNSALERPLFTQFCNPFIAASPTVAPGPAEPPLGACPPLAPGVGMLPVAPGAAAAAAAARVSPQAQSPVVAVASFPGGLWRSGSTTRRSNPNLPRLDELSPVTPAPIGADYFSSAPAVVPEAAAVAPARAAPPRTAARTHGGAAGVAVTGVPPGLRILVAEDNRVNQKVILKVLERVLPPSAGCTTTIVNDGEEALEALADQVYDIVFMDIHMPRCDGLEASRRIRETYAPQDRPHIVALSADTLKSLHERCSGVGIREFICKPFRVEDLQRVLRSARTLPRLRTHYAGGGSED